MEQVSAEEIGRGGRGLEFSKGLTIEDLGRNKDLVAAHNLSEDKLHVFGCLIADNVKLVQYSIFIKIYI